MMQILNKVFRHKFVEKRGRLLFWSKKRRASILLVSRNKGNRSSSLLCENRKEMGTVLSLTKGACSLFPPSFFPCFTLCLPLVRFDKNQRMT